MANEVFANGREISCKSGDGKVIAAFPDVCFTPPENPATPPGVPVPYPISSFSSDNTEGTKNVKINGKEVMLRNISYFSKCTGDEAGCAAKKGIITSSNVSKTYFKSWSMDVKFEGQNVVRHLDLTTSNHRSEIGNESATFPEIESMAKSVQRACSDEIKAATAACAGRSPANCGAACRKAQKCILVPKGNDKERCCKPHTTGHHMIEDHWVTRADGSARPGFGGYDYDAAPTVCANRFRKKGTVHRRLHDIQGTFEESYMPGGSRHKPKMTNGGCNYGAGKEAALIAHAHVFSGSKCRQTCMKAQLDAYYGNDNSRPLGPPETQVLGSRRAATAKFIG
jgi:hypothetical protein